MLGADRSPAVVWCVLRRARIKPPKQAARGEADPVGNARLLAEWDAWEADPVGKKQDAIARAANATTAPEVDAAMKRARRLVNKRAEREASLSNAMRRWLARRTFAAFLNGHREEGERQKP